MSDGNGSNINPFFSLKLQSQSLHKDVPGIRFFFFFSNVFRITPLANEVASWPSLVVPSRFTLLFIWHGLLTHTHVTVSLDMVAIIFVMMEVWDGQLTHPMFSETSKSSL